MRGVVLAEPGATGVEQATGGAQFVRYLATDGLIRCWGDDGGYGHLGTTSPMAGPAPYPIDDPG